MKFIKIIFFVLLALIVVPSFGQTFPPKANPPKLVNDYLNLLTPDQQQALEQKLVDFDKRTSTQVTIVTINDISGMDAGDYAVSLGKNWGVGNSNFNNGVVFLVYRSKDGNTRKVFIAPGTGLEGVLPDYTCSEIVNNEVIPNLKAGDYYHALNSGVDGIIQATEGKYTAPDNYGNRKGPSMFKIIFLIFIIIIVLSMINKGGGGGSYMSRRGYRGFAGPSIWWTGGGGSSNWGGGGSSGGGGFGGFGGGGFGGGGAGGDW
jgi:uncharacterized protein